MRLLIRPAGVIATRGRKPQSPLCSLPRKEAAPCPEAGDRFTGTSGVPVRRRSGSQLARVLLPVAKTAGERSIGLVGGRGCLFELGR